MRAASITEDSAQKAFTLFCVESLLNHHNAKHSYMRSAIEISLFYTIHGMSRYTVMHLTGPYHWNSSAQKAMVSAISLLIAIPLTCRVLEALGYQANQTKYAKKCIRKTAIIHFLR